MHEYVEQHEGAGLRFGETTERSSFGRVAGNAQTAKEFRMLLEVSPAKFDPKILVPRVEVNSPGFFAVIKVVIRIGAGIRGRQHDPFQSIRKARPVRNDVDESQQIALADDVAGVRTRDSRSIINRWVVVNVRRFLRCTRPSLTLVAVRRLKVALTISLRWPVPPSKDAHRSECKWRFRRWRGCRGWFRQGPFH